MDYWNGLLGRFKFPVVFSLQLHVYSLTAIMKMHGKIVVVNGGILCEK